MRKGIKLLVATLLFAATFGSTVAFAAGSPVANGTGSAEVNGEKVAVEFSSDFTAVKDEKAAVAVKAIAADPSKLVEALTTAGVDTVSGTKTSDIELASKLQDLTVPGATKDVTVTWEVPGLVAKEGYSVKVLHYSTARNVWELITPSKVAGSSVTAKFADLSPVAVVYVKDAPKGSVNTADNTSNALYYGLAAASIVAVATIVVLKKKEVL